MVSNVHTARNGPRAMWKGVIRADSVSLPIKLFSAVRESRVEFHLLHAPDGLRVEQHMVNPVTGKEVAREDIRRGYPLGGDRFALLEPDELEKLVPEKSRDVEVTRFVPSSSIAPAWYVRPYYVGPDGDVTGYRGLVEALEKRKRVGVAHWTMRNASHTGALCVRQGQLLLVKLRERDAVVSAEELHAPEGRGGESRELALAEQLVSALAGPFEPEKLHDEHRKRLQALIDAKAKGRTPKLETPVRRAPAAPLASALRRSVEQATRNRSKAHG
jgi:DNA end-binding protein Ku